MPGPFRRRTARFLGFERLTVLGIEEGMIEWRWD